MEQAYRYSHIFRQALGMYEAMEKRVFETEDIVRRYIKKAIMKILN